MDFEETLALLSIERPAGWLRHRDGAWAPVWATGLVGAAFTTAELHTITTAEPLHRPDTPVAGDITTNENRNSS